MLIMRFLYSSFEFMKAESVFKETRRTHLINSKQNFY